MQDSRTITRKSASNLALAFVLLPKAKRQGMSALYAFCREVDDIADNVSLSVSERRTRLNQWRADIQRACAGQPPHFLVNQELQPFIARHRLPAELFEELIYGVEMDLDINRYDTWEDLELYCYRVASVVGLLSIEIFGYQHQDSRMYADSLGKALQLTNILRDVRTDAERGRIYLPRAELARHGVTEAEIIEGQYSERFRKVAAAVATRARGFYHQARASLPASDRRNMAAAELMGSVYWRLMQKLERQGFNVFGAEPMRLSTVHKAALIFRTWYKILSGSLVPNYGTP